MPNTYKEEALTSLIHFLNEGNEAERCFAARSLGAIQSNSAIPSLAAKLRDEDIDVCIDAAAALGKIAQADAIPYLLEALEKESDGEIKTTIANTLGYFNNDDVKAALFKLATQRPEDMEEETEDWDSYWDIQLEAIKSLTRQGGHSDARTLAALIDDEDAQDIESEILKLLASSGEAGFDALQERLNATFSRTRRRAIHALGFQNSAASRQAIKQALQDENDEVRIAALASTAKLNATELFSDVIALLSDPSAQIRTQVLKVLANFAESTSEVSLGRSHLMPLLADVDEDVRITLLSLLKAGLNKGQIQLEENDFETIQKSVGAESVQEAVLACELLSYLRTPESIHALIEVLGNAHTDQYIRKEAAVSLGQLGQTTSAVMQALQQQTTGHSRLVRLSALEALLALETATQDQQVVQLIEPDAEHVEGDESIPTPISDPMELLIASLYGNLVSEEEEEQQHQQQPDMGGLERIEATNIDKTADETEMADSQPQFVDATQSTLASMQAGTEAPALIPESYPANYPEAEAENTSTVMSTMEALTRENVEATLISSQPVEPHVQSIMTMIADLPEELQTFGDTVKANNAVADQMIDKGKNSKPKDDVKHLAARVLSALDVSPKNLLTYSADKVERIIAGLIMAVSDEDEQLRCEAAETIGQLAQKNPKTPGLNNAFGGLVTQLQFGTPDFRVKAVKALGALEHKAAIPPLLDSLEDADANVRAYAIRSLGTLMHSNWSDQKASHHMVLENVTTKKIIDRVNAMLSDPNNTVRRAAIELLTDVQHQAAVENMLVIALENEGAMARVVGQALRKMKATDASHTLTQRLQEAENMSDRRFLMEMIEEMFKPERVDKTTEPIA